MSNYILAFIVTIALSAMFIKPIRAFITILHISYTKLTCGCNWFIRLLVKTLLQIVLIMLIVLIVGLCLIFAVYRFP